ncbi:ras guanine nucleotide exchange factor domain-containing protein [Fimicolochytrium jonesii]|uniref:ras guanine nucleotide exchange factor domain-containing protein n=1 Tax=Fimicolochytrium jonesii TaxID=1396493 RepID=UPI0022FEF528|nr:ras guanine nucleotide exchange factor domain-containing protein [Fimicolochytrium jonesii]KAI8827072.1 ras guanine nucleotide exchange factor domain-containing protein [Fimicolochytrium jonesii]
MAIKVVRALYDYAGSEDSGLSFRKGDIIQVLTQLDSGWWDGLLYGERGWFPSNYVGEPETLKDAPTADQVQGSVWVRQIGHLGNIYYFNRDTGATTQDTPTTFAPATESNGNAADYFGAATNALDLPPGWIVYDAEAGGPMYYNHYTKETRWTRPETEGDLAPDSATTRSSVPSSPGGLLTPTSSRGSFSFSRQSSILSRSDQSSSRPSTASTSPTSTTANRASQGLPPNWGMKVTLERRPYYYNMVTDETTWTLEDIDTETGNLVPSPQRKPSNASVNSERSSMGSHSSILNMLPPILPTDEAVSSPNLTWAKLANDIISRIHQLNQYAKHGKKEGFVSQSSLIVESIRIMLYASGTARKDAPSVASHKMVKVHHRQIMSSLSKLVLHAKEASGVWPPPDSVVSLQQATNEVLVSVRQFVAAAQEAGVEVQPLTNGEAAAIHSSGSSSNTAPPPSVTDGELGPGLGQLASNQSRDSMGSDTGLAAVAEQQLLTQQTNPELVTCLENYTRSIFKMLTEVARHVRQGSIETATIIKQVKVTVMEVGNLLALVDEIPLDSVSEDLTLEFKVNRLNLYNSVTGLVTATQVSTQPLAPINAMEQVLLSAGLLEKAVKDMLISTKFLVAERENAEQASLVQYIDKFTRHRTSSASSNDGNGSLQPRRAMSLSILNNAIPEDGSPIPAQGSESAPSTPLPIDESGEPGRSFFARSASTPLIPVHQMSPARSTRAHGVTSDRASKSSDSSDGGLHFMNQNRVSLHSDPNMGSAQGSRASVHSGKTEDPAKPWFLQYDYSERDVSFSPDGKLRGATLDALIERLTLHDGLDPEVLSTFLLTYRSFTDSVTFIQLLKRRFSMEAPSELTVPERDLWLEKKRTPIRIRVFNVARNWIDNHASFEDPVDRQAMVELKQFAQTDVMPFMEAAGKQLIKSIEKKESGESSARRMILNPNREYPVPVVPRNLKKIKFLDLDATEVARQLTIMEAKQYNKLEPGEFLNRAWSEKDGNAAVNVKALINMSNQITGWVAATILSEKDLKKRAAIFKQFILVADRCRALNNFNTLMSILAGLNSAPVHRLNRTRELLSARIRNMFEALRATMTPLKNFSAYRETLHSVNPPCVPFLGFYLTDLTFIEDGNSDMLRDHNAHLINFFKRMKTAGVIQEIQQYQNAPYVLMPVPELQTWLRSNMMVEVDDSDLYDKSLVLEPRERPDEIIARKLLENGLM